MARTEEQYREVADIAHEIYRTGVKDPSAPAIRKILITRRAGTGMKVGSPNSIQADLMRWRATERPADATAPIQELPASVVAEINRSMLAAAAHARQNLEPKLEMLSLELKEAVESGKLYEAQIEEMAAILAERTRERDVSAGQTHEQTIQVHALTASLAREQALAANLRLDLARVEIGTQMAIARADEALEREKKLHDEVLQVRGEFAAEHAFRVEADRRSDIACTRLESEAQARMSADAHIAELLGVVRGIEGAVGRATAAEASALELRSQVAMLQKLLSAATPVRRIGMFRQTSAPALAAAGTASQLIAVEAPHADTVEAGPPSVFESPNGLHAATTAHRLAGDSEQPPLDAPGRQ